MYVVIPGCLVHCKHLDEISLCSCWNLVLQVMDYISQLLCRHQTTLSSQWISLRAAEKRGTRLPAHINHM